MILYITYGEYASGIYSSQVIDTCRELSTLTSQKIKLVSIISIKGFFEQRRKILASFDDALVLPMFPKMKYFKANIFLLSIYCFFSKPYLVLCRNTIPAKLGLMLRNLKLTQKVIFDGRAAEYEQFVEYKMINDALFLSKFLKIEREVVNLVDYRISVSQKLVDYWVEKFKYDQNKHTIIPCTLNTKHLHHDEILLSTREQYGYKKEDILLVYSGSVAQWQSFDLLFSFFEKQINKNPYIKILLLTKKTSEINAFMSIYPDKIQQIWCREEEVYELLSLADYGILLREDTWTNKVASPVKFAEYLNAGLNVIISQAVGDFSDFVVNHKCGHIYHSKPLDLIHISDIQRKHNKLLVNDYFNKKSNYVQQKYKDVLKNINYAY